MFRDIFSKLINPNRFDSLILFVTSRCNSRCRHCFYWRNLNQKDKLDLKQIEKIVKTAPPLVTLLISGGEPFLRKDLTQIINLFVKNNRLKAVAIPTNGLLPKVIYQETLKILRNNPQVALSINLSIDGLKETHDRIRGVRGNFEKSLETIELLQSLLEKHPSLTVNLETVINKENLSEIPKLMEFFLRENFNQVKHYFEIIRGEAKDLSLKEIPEDQLKKLYKEIINYQAKKMENYFPNSLLLKKIKVFLAKVHLAALYKIQLENFAHGKRWPDCCLAGRKIAVIDSLGKLSACELRRPVLALKDYDFNFNQALASKKMKKELNEITTDKCDCTHVCFIYEMMHSSPKFLFLTMPFLAIKYIFLRRFF